MRVVNHQCKCEVWRYCFVCFDNLTKLWVFWLAAFFLLYMLYHAIHTFSFWYIRWSSGARSNNDHTGLLCRQKILYLLFVLFWSLCDHTVHNHSINSFARRTYLIIATSFRFDLQQKYKDLVQCVTQNDEEANSTCDVCRNEYTAVSSTYSKSLPDVRDYVGDGWC